MHDATLSNQWMTREADERFTDLFTMGAKFNDLDARSCGKVVSSRDLVFEADPADPMKGMLIKGRAGTPFAPTNFAFGQACQRAASPAGYLRNLPAPLAADCLNYSMRFLREPEDVGILIRRAHGDDVTGELAAMTGPNYGRVKNSSIINQAIKRFGNGVDGDWRIPGEFGQAVKPTKANTTLYASDHDCFVFLADEINRIEMKERRDGKSGSLARGFYFSNSEVGASKLVLGMYLFDYTCSNRIIWGIADTFKIGIRHTASAPDRFVEQFLPALDALRTMSAGPIEAAIKDAQLARVDKDVEAFLKARKFTGSEITGMKSAFLADEGRPLIHNDATTLWDLTTAATALARQIPFADDRANLEARGGALMDLVAVRA